MLESETIKKHWLFPSAPNSQMEGRQVRNQPLGCLIGILKLHVQSWLEFSPKTCSSHSLPHFSERQWSFFHFCESEVLEPSLASLFLSHSIAASIVGFTFKIHAGYSHFSATSLDTPMTQTIFFSCLDYCSSLQISSLFPSFMGFPGSSDSKESARNIGDLGLVLG